TPHIHIYKPLEIKDEKIITQNRAVGSNDWNVVIHQKPKNELSKIKNGLTLMQRLERIPGVKGVAPQVSTQVFYNNGPVKVPGNIYGIDVARQKELFQLDKKMDIGDLDELLKGSDV